MALNEIWPQAPLYTSVYDPKKAKWAKVFNVIPSWLQYIPFAKNHHQLLSLLTPHAFRKFDLSQYELVISITSAEAKTLSLPKNVKHICYCLTPTRYLWSQKANYEDLGLRGRILKISSPFSRMLDFSTATKINKIISISTYIEKQVYKYYLRESDVIFPPVEVTTEKEAIKPLINNYYLVVSRLVSYKRIDLAIKACEKLHRKLVVVGIGEEEASLKKLAGKHTVFAGHLTERELAGYYMHCKALLFPGLEDFGITPLEAQAYGKAVIAYGRGGVLDTIIDKETGLFFHNQNETSLIRAIMEFEKSTFDSKKCKINSEKFGKTNFKRQFKQYIEKYMNEN